MRRLIAATCAIAALTLTGCGQSMDSVQKEMARREAESASLSAVNQTAGLAFMEKTGKEPGVVTLPSGLMYKIVSSPNPTAPSPKASDTVTINYEGKLLDGSVFDSSYARNEPASFPLGQLVEAWRIALPMMHKGDTWMLYVPSKLGYGEADMGEIPPNSTLVFKIQLLDFKS